mgnify:CR=1 FL=1
MIPKVTHATVLGISCKELKSMHAFTKNSPAVVLQCADFIETTSTQAYKGKNAAWLDLGWHHYLTQSSTAKLTVNSGSLLIGTVEITTQDLYSVVPDDLGRSLIQKPILFEGETFGFVNM